MKDVETAIILAAGSSRRMGDFTANKPKSLLPYRGEPILQRLLRQLDQAGIAHVILVVGYQQAAVRELVDGLAANSKMRVEVVENSRYSEDTNIWSMKLALERATGSVTIFEADTIMEDDMVVYACGSDFEGKSAWFTKGPFTSDMYGGIIKSDDQGTLVDVQVVKAWAPELSEHTKMTGVMRICGDAVPRCSELVAEAAGQTLQQYFFTPWCSHLAELHFVEGDARHYSFRSFNTPDEYQELLDVEFDSGAAPEARIEMVEVAALKHIEDFDAERVDALLEKITTEGTWTKPLYTERNHDLVLDGQHRLEVALRLGLSKVPVQRFDYDDVAVWTLRKEQPVDVPTVIERANRGDIYPYKTVKHKFPNVIAECSIPLDTLRKQ